MATAVLAVSIVRYTTGHPPGWVVCQFTDSHGRTYTSGEIKQVDVGHADLDEDTPYPVPGALNCLVVGLGDGVTRVTLDEAWAGVEEYDRVYEVSSDSVAFDEPDAV